MAEQLALTPQQRMLVSFLGAGEPSELDPIRVMKGLFIFTMEAPEEWWRPEDRYGFVAYDYGPCAFGVYSDLEYLEALGYVATSEAPERSWKYHSLTAKGRQLAEGLMRDMWAPAAQYLEKVRAYVCCLSFYQLLAAVYRKYPDYAVNSVFGSQD